MLSDLKKLVVKNTNMQNWTWRILVACALSGIGFALIAFFGFTNSFRNVAGTFDPLLASQFGNFIGGLVGPMFYLAGFFLLYETIIAQNKSFEKQQFETKFFELLRFHRQNVSEMEYRLPYEEHKYITGSLVFREIKSQFTKLHRIAIPFVEAAGSIPADRKKTGGDRYLLPTSVFWCLTKYTADTRAYPGEKI